MGLAKWWATHSFNRYFYGAPAMFQNMGLRTGKTLLSRSLQCSLETTHKQVNTEKRLFRDGNCYKGKTDIT